MKSSLVNPYLKIVSLLTLVLLFSCTTEPLNDHLVKEDASMCLATKALDPIHDTPYFDWEDTSSVYIVNNGNVLLPWIGGATSNIATEIVNDYHRAHGWELLYNLCSDPLLNPYGHKNYLIFYNKIRGVLRVYCYKSSDATGDAKDTYMHLSSSSSSRIWDFSQGVYSLDSDASATSTYIPNRSNNNYTSGLSIGWNCFEVELAYDNISSGEHNTFNIDLFDRIHYDLEFKGLLSGVTTGNIIFPSSSSSGSSAIQQYGQAAKTTLNSIDTIIDTLKNTSLSNSGVITIVSEALSIINALYGLFSSDNSLDNTSVSTNNITLTMDTKFNATGSFETNTPTGGSAPVANLLLPGCASQSGDEVLPHYNQKLGAWNIVNTPTVYRDNEYTPQFYEVLAGPSGYFHYGMNHDQKHSLSGLSIIINPETLNCIDGYDYEISYYYLYKYEGDYVGRTLTGVDYINDYPYEVNQYLKKCVYEVSRSASEIHDYLIDINQRRAENGLSLITESGLNSEQKLKTVIYKVEPNYADRIINDVNSISVMVDQSATYNEVRNTLRQAATYPSAPSVDNYIARVKMVFHIKEEYGGGDYVSIKTYVPEIASRGVSHTVDNFLPYYQRPEAETDSYRWAHRWDWAN